LLIQVKFSRRALYSVWPLPGEFAYLPMSLHSTACRSHTTPRQSSPQTESSHTTRQIVALVRSQQYHLRRPGLPQRAPDRHAPISVPSSGPPDYWGSQDRPKRRSVWAYLVLQRRWEIGGPRIIPAGADLGSPGLCPSTRTRLRARAKDSNNSAKAETWRLSLAT